MPIGRFVFAKLLTSANSPSVLSNNPKGCIAQLNRKILK